MQYLRWLINIPGTDKQSFGFGGTGKKSHDRQFDDYGPVFTKDDVITCLMDLDEGAIAYWLVPQQRTMLCQAIMHDAARTVCLLVSHTHWPPG